MCGVFAFFIDSPTNSSFELIKRVISESEIRGMHATGLSFIDNSGIITTEILPTRGTDFVKSMGTLDSYKSPDGRIIMIGHCRYSTSDLMYNQPISSKDYSIAHNGVITQIDPSSWKGVYGYDTETRNDSELILRTVEAGKSPLVEHKESSIACVELGKGGSLRFYRNGKRPLFYSKTDGALIISSTKNILKRSGVLNYNECEHSTYYNYSGDVIESEYIETSFEDLQNAV